MDQFIAFIKSLIPMLPTLVIVYAVIKLFSSGLNLISKVISLLIGVALIFVLWNNLFPMLMI